MRIIVSLWLRDLLRLRREPSRWLGVVSQPLLFWGLIGSGIGERFRLEGEGGYLHYFYPGTLVMVILFSSIFSSMSLIEERQAGFLKFILTLSHARLPILLGKILGVFSIIVFQLLLFLIFLPYAGFEFQRVNFITLGIVVFLGTISLSALNFAGAWVLNSTHAYHGLMSLIFLPLWMVSGAMFPLEGPFLSYLNWLNPLAFIVEGVRLSFIGVPLGIDFFPNMIKLVLSAFFSLVLTLGIMRKIQNEFPS
jgi:ABC-2 type transport system permease protein